jgi:lipopolysaccharide/colanic/teichoic acid biosynthesis glycosyltransferase
VNGGLKRVIDLLLATVGSVLSFPLILVCAIAVFLSDGRNPFYVSMRIGRGALPFRLFKIRTMVVGASLTGTDTTVTNDPRLLAVGRVVRATKLDELPQLWNVLLGEMSFVGPRPNVSREVARYTDAERGLLIVRPGITDFASIVFADLADAIPTGVEANLGYNQFVRPWKSRLGLHYVDHASLAMDLRLLLGTFVNFFARRRALEQVSSLLRRTGASSELCAIALRQAPLQVAVPPGAARAVVAEDLQKSDGV